MGQDRVQGRPATGPLVRPVARGTAPLGQVEEATVAPPAANAKPPRGPQGPRVGPLGRGVPAVALEQVEVPSAPLPPPKPRERKGFWGRLGEAAGQVLDKAGDAAKGGLDLLGDGAQVATEGLGALLGEALEAVGAQGAARATRQGAKAVGQGLNRALDTGGELANLGLDALGAGVGDPLAMGQKLAERVLGPEVYPGQIEGLTGAIANRLEPGEGAFLTGTAKVTLPTQTVAAILSLGAGAAIPNLEGEFTAAAEMSRGPSGKLRLALTVKASEAAIWEAGVGAKLKGRFGGSEFGFEAGAKVEGEVAASQSLKVNLEFDPSRPEDVARLRALIEPKALDLVNPLSFTLNHGGALQEALAKNRTSVEVGADFGAKGSLKLSGNAGRLGEEGGLEAGALGAKLGLKLSAKAGVTVETMRDGGRKVNVSASAGGELDLRLPAGFSTRDGLRGATRFAVETGPDGKLRELSAQLSEGVDLGGGKMSGSEVRNLITGRHSEQRTVILKLNEEGLKRAQARVDGGELAASVFAELVQDPKLVQRQLRTLQADAFGVGVEGGLTLGVGKVDFSLMLEAGRTFVRSEDLRRMDLNETNDMVMQGPGNRR